LIENKKAIPKSVIKPNIPKRIDIVISIIAPFKRTQFRWYKTVSVTHFIETGKATKSPVFM
ncbi:MAG: hypothetical protein DWQ10_04085, partial [Calditrichaeota bacterium]